MAAAVVAAVAPSAGPGSHHQASPKPTSKRKGTRPPKPLRSAVNRKGRKGREEKEKRRLSPVREGSQEVLQKVAEVRDIDLELGGRDGWKRLDTAQQQGKDEGELPDADDEGEEEDAVGVVLSPRSTQAKPLLTRAWIYKHLKALNEAAAPVLEREGFVGVYTATVKRSAAEGWLHRVIEEVWEDVGWKVVEGIFWAKEQKGGVTGTVRVEGYGKDFNMDTPMLGQFLIAINGFVKAKNEASLADWLVLEPPFSDNYTTVIRELQTHYPKGAEDALEQKCSDKLPAAREGEDGSPWTQFVKFMAQYLCFLRDIDDDPAKYLQTYDLLSELQVRVNSALTHATLGFLVLPVVVRCARLVCRLAIGLDRRPEMIAQLKSGGGGGEEGGPRETLPERAANTLRTGFVTCLNDRSSGINKDGTPAGKKRGIYTIANLCLKILFQCRKTRNATQIFSNISNLSPPLAAYPKPERVTYLYYLGRFYFQNSHFYRAQHVLQRAYDEAPASERCVRQRRHILVYLVASNIILGRFPSEALLSRPEARGLAERFVPLCHAIRKGDLASFHRHMDLDGEHAEWFLHFRILLQLRNRCEVLVWRSLVRKVFLLVGTTPNMEGGNSRAAPTLNIAHLVTAFTFLEKKSQSTLDAPIDDDFSGVDIPPDPEILLPDTTAIESKLSSLIDQGFLRGFISHKQMKFAITGSKAKGGALAAGFPSPWEVVRRKAEQEGQGGHVPGWKKDGIAAGGLGGGGRVVNLRGARPVGVFG